MIRKAGLRFIILAFAVALAASCVCSPDEVENVVEDVRVTELPPGVSPAVSAALPAENLPAKTVAETVAAAPTPAVTPATEPQPVSPPVAVTTTTTVAPPVSTPTGPVIVQASPAPATVATPEAAPAPVPVLPAAATAIAPTATTSTTTTTTTTLPSPVAAAALPATTTTTLLAPVPSAPKPVYPDPVLPDLSPLPSGPAPLAGASAQPYLDGMFYVLPPSGADSTTTIIPASPLVPGKAANVSRNTTSVPVPPVTSAPNQAAATLSASPAAVAPPAPAAPSEQPEPSAAAASNPPVADVPPRLDPVTIEMALSPMPFSPDSDGVNDRAVFTPKVSDPSRISEWRLSVYEDSGVLSAVGGESTVQKTGKPFKEWKGIGAPPYSITWDGKDTSGRLVESATDYAWVFAVKDSFGREAGLSGLLPVDILVVREAGRLRIKVPSIVFRSDRADFMGLNPEGLAANTRIISRIAAILEKYPSFSILIEGHGNNVGKMSGYSAARIAAEEKNEVIPLSTARAEFVRILLSVNGIDPKRMTARGMGSSIPLYDPKNAALRQKNRRVEFILTGK